MYNVRNYGKLVEPTKNAAIMLADRWPDQSGHVATVPRKL